MTGPSPDLSTEAGARNEARRILAGRDFHAKHTPRPLRGVLAWIGDRLNPLGAPFRWLGHQSGLGLAVAGGVVIAAAAAAAAFVIWRRAGAVQLDVEQRRRLRRSLDPDELERAADEAERVGDLEHALRLRFRAALLRLDRAGALTYRPTLTTGEVRRRVRTPVVADLTRTVDEVVYGRRPALAEDVAAARSGWPAVLDEVSR